MIREFSARPDEGSPYITLKDMREIVTAADEQGYPDTALICVDVPMEFRSPAHVVRVVVTTATD